MEMIMNRGRTRLVGMAALIALALGAASLAGARPAIPGAGNREAKLLGQMREACGGDAWDRVQGWHETGSIEMPAMPGLRYEAFHDMASLRTTYIQRVGGKLVRLGGFDGTTGWRMTPDGGILRETDPATLRRTRRDMYLSNSAYLLPNRFAARFELVGVRAFGGQAFDVLRVTPANADSAELWIDRATHHVGRIVAGNEIAVASDYRSFGSVCAPIYLRQSDGNPAHDVVLRVETVDTAPVNPARFVPAPSAVPR
jgi:hypothetical protein